MRASEQLLPRLFCKFIHYSGPARKGRLNPSWTPFQRLEKQCSFVAIMWLFREKRVKQRNNRPDTMWASCCFTVAVAFHLSQRQELKLYEEVNHLLRGFGSKENLLQDRFELSKTMNQITILVSLIFLCLLK
ncbi:hypothetical protein K501DRAFT_280725 [Backusella circina FSU 941]|nr:hypothetical protein K501DRAFT_280725 [Backusella circina FSU 941]